MGCKLAGLFRFSYSIANLRFFFNWKWLALLALLLCPSHSRYRGCHLFAMWSLAPTALWLTWWGKLAQGMCLEANPVLGHLEIMEQCTELPTRADKRVRLKLDQICPPTVSACLYHNIACSPANGIWHESMTAEENEVERENGLAQLRGKVYFCKF